LNEFKDRDFVRVSQKMWAIP